MNLKGELICQKFQMELHILDGNSNPGRVDISQIRVHILNGSSYPQWTSISQVKFHMDVMSQMKVNIPGEPQFPRWTSIFHTNISDKSDISDEYSYIR